MWKQLFEALLKGHKHTAGRNAIAKSLAQSFLYEDVGIESLHPDVKTKVKRLMRRMQTLKMPVTLSEGYRSFKKQNDYYAKGRTKAGKKITNAKGGQSYHQYGLAADLISKKYGWKPPQNFWETLGIEAKKLGFEWGGDWKFKDVAHVQYRPLNVHWRELKSYFTRSS